MRITVLPAARDDLRDIWRLGAATWGVDQADRYSDGLDAAIASLGAQPFAGPAVDHIRPGLRRLIVRSHTVFYDVEGKTLRVIRVLHQSRDASRWLT